MKIIFDEDKNKRNIAKHGLAFTQVVECDWSDPLIYTDRRREYGETRYNAYVDLQGRLHNVVFTKRGDDMRVISFRKANERARKNYAKETQR